ncbi:MAG: FAD-dependent monooxygenase [Gammaproteobacteria bacterium]|nr:FAD-dependent monooxygenase [Gammaproteobacteria bacterium]
MSSAAIDELVVGGGPAGMAAGISFGRAGLRTLVCERGALPADKPCGEGVMPAGLPCLERLGVSAYLDPDHRRPFTGVHYLSTSGAGASARFAEGPGQGIRRTELSRAFCERARKIDTLDVRARTPVTLGRRGPNGAEAWLDGRKVTARLIVGADGLRSEVRRWSGLQGVSTRRRRFAVQQHFRCQPWSEYVEVHWAGDAEAYVTPCGREEVGVAVLWAAEEKKTVGGQRLMASMLSRFPRLSRSLRGAEPAVGARAIGPMHQVARSPISDGVGLVGDASGYLDAVTGEGISLALAQVQALYDSIGPWMLSHDRAPTARELQGYSRRISAMVRQHRRITRLVLFLSRNPRLAERAIKGLGRQPELFRWLLSANMGAVSAASMPKLEMMRLATALVRG